MLEMEGDRLQVEILWWISLNCESFRRAHVLTSGPRDPPWHTAW